MEIKKFEKQRKSSKEFKPIHSLELRKGKSKNHQQNGVEFGEMPGSSAMYNRSTNPTNPTLADQQEMTTQLRIVG